MKLQDITNSECDVRRYMKLGISDEARHELENFDTDVDSVLDKTFIYVAADKLDKEIVPFDIDIHTNLNENQQIVLEWLKDDFKESGNPIDSLESLANEVLHVETFQTCISSTYDDLSINEQFQLLAAFAEWGMKEVVE